MKGSVFAFVFAAVGAMAVCAQRDVAAGGGARGAFTLNQTVEIRNGSGGASLLERTFVQRADGAYVQIEAYQVADLGRCESGGIFTGASRVSYNTCAEARSTFPARGEVAVRNRLRRRESCTDFLAGAKAGPNGSMWGVRTEEYVLSNRIEDAVYVVSPELGCQSLSEVHRWKAAGGAPSGAVTVLTTTELKPGAEGRYFMAAEKLHEMAPSRARSLWAAKLGHSAAAPWFQKANARLDEQYRRPPANQ